MDAERAPDRPEPSPIVGVAFEYHGQVFVGRRGEEHVDLRARLGETISAFATEAIYDDPALRSGWGTADGKFLTTAEAKAYMRRMDETAESTA